jgi:hypothetical protein
MIDALKHRLSLLGYAWRTVGPGTMLRNALRYPLDRDAHNSNTDLDARFGIDTTADLTPREARIPNARERAATMYIATADVDLDAMLGSFTWPREEDATFIDIGSGKGRVVLRAAMRPFREVIGLELSPVLHATAQRNLEVVKPTGALRSPVRLVLGDATELEVPAGPLVAFLYHPFAESIAALVIDRLVASLAASPRPAAILYGHPTLQQPFDPSVFERGRVFTPHAQGGRQTSYYRIGWSVWTNELWATQQRAG